MCGIPPQVWYGDKTESEVNVHRLVGYVDQYDNHLPLLTVRETMEYSLRYLVDAASPLVSPELRTVAKSRANTMIRLLGLTNAANTILGDELLRGVSGGEVHSRTIV